MLIKRTAYSILITLGTLGVSCAQESKPTATPAEALPTPLAAPAAPASVSSPTNQNQSAPQIRGKTAEKRVTETSPKVSEKEKSKYMLKVSGLIAARARALGSIGDGSAATSFRINDKGNIDNISIKSSSSPQHAGAAKKILSGVHAGPSPAGPISLNQTFRFH